MVNDVEEVGVTKGSNVSTSCGNHEFLCKNSWPSIQQLRFFSVQQSSGLNDSAIHSHAGSKTR